MGLKTFLGLKKRRPHLHVIPAGAPPGIHCNICGSNDFRDMNGRKEVFCAICHSLERTRLMKLYLDREGLPRNGMRILHLAPETGLAKYLISVVGDKNYEARDIDTDRYKHINVSYIDLLEDTARLPSNHYDLIVHSHVMEHLPCNITAILYHLHRSLTKNGVHLFSIPILPGCYEESLFPMSDEERTRRFFQFDHVRRFGVDDLHRSVGMIFKMPMTSDIVSEFGADVLDRYNVDQRSRLGYQHGVFMFRKNDLLLR